MEPEDNAPKEALLAEFSRLAKALAAPSRLELVDLLAQGERGVEDLARATGLRLSNASAQLQILASAGVVARRRSGAHVYYRLADPRIAPLVEQLKLLACDLLPAAREAARALLGDAADLEPVSRADLAARLAAGDVAVVDVRPGVEYAAAHIDGALGIPLDELPDRLAELPDDLEVVAYCRGRYCRMSARAVRLLHRHGRAARVLDGGLAEWRAAGLPTAA
ncbi:ArsR/SmtB family transcription factor [Actinomadura atramentaria]|uniref:ArsR/SmtB family transcription factor n=1 Tax=Actinomadura atramentaria TaxID=1990 RepID=UPI000372D980|nr:metalloregulator ArsR/SmtB family transcription factor [Actinomadura atramentaria]